MIRLVLRSLAYLLLAAAFALAVIDALRAIETERLVLTPVEQAAGALLSTQPAAFETFVKGHVPEFLWEPAVVLLLRLPAVPVLSAMAVVLFRFALRKPKKFEFPTY